MLNSASLGASVTFKVHFLEFILSSFCEEILTKEKRAPTGDHSCASQVGQSNVLQGCSMAVLGE